MSAPAVGSLVLHAAGPCGRVTRVWEPGEYVASPGAAPVSCAVVELSTGDALCLDEGREPDFAVVPDPLATAYELLLLPRARLLVSQVRSFAAKLASEGAPVDGALLARLLTAALREALKPPRGRAPG